MEGTEHSSSKPQANGEHHQTALQEPEEQLGLGFQKPSVSPDSNLDPPSVSKDESLNQIVAEELQNLSLQRSINDEDNRVAFEQVTDEDREAIHGGNHQIAVAQAISEAFEDESSNQAADEAITASHPLGDKLHYPDMKNTKLNVEQIDHNDVVKAKIETEPENTPAFEENKVNEEEKVFNKEDKGKKLKESISTKYRNNCGETENEDSNNSKVREEEGNHDYENNWSESENDEENARNEMEEYGTNTYEVERSENEQDQENNGYNNVEGDSLGIAGIKNGKYRRYHYPLRPDAEDCSYYLKTGMCKFGSNCKFNHPLKRRYQAAKEASKKKEEISDRLGQTECKYYSTPGGCKYGKACRYNHGGAKALVAPILEFNFLGLPIRLGEKDCPYYMRNGSCKYGSNCRFNHHDPTAMGGGDSLSGYGDGSVQGSLKDNIKGRSLARTLNENTTFVPVLYSPAPGVPSSNPEWNGYQALVYPTPESSLPTPPAFSMNILATDANFYTHHQQQMPVEEFPERPGQPECSYFMKTGDCKYRSGCKFHHPKNWNSKISSFSQSGKGPPSRPDQNICTHYSRYGICKSGPSCRFNHPVNYGNSASESGSGPGQPPVYGNSAPVDGQWRKREPLIQQSHNFCISI